MSKRVDHPIILGIVGDSASGKTTLSAGVAQILGAEHCTVICTDDYHRYSRAERAAAGLSALDPRSNYIDVLEQHLRLLRSGEPILKPVYDHRHGTLECPQYVKPKEFVIAEGLLGYATRAMRDCYDVKIFLDPELKGKILWHDPLIPGSGETFAIVMRKILGDEGLKTFVTEQVVFTANMMDLVDKMARGQYAIAMGPVLTSLLKRYQNAGLDFDIRPLGNTPELAAYSNTGGSNLIVMKDAPHPNAARVFVNWLNSKDVAIKLAKATDQDSNREDIPSQVDPARARIPGATYEEPQRESEAGALKESHELIKSFRAGRS